MRLTNVVLMALPPGRLLSLPAHTVGLPGRPLAISFDQRRHVGAGQRPGSWMAISARLPEHVTSSEVARAWQAVIRRHGSLRTAFSLDANGSLTLHEVQVELGDWIEHEAVPGRPTRELMREVFDQACAPFEQPSHRLVLVLPDRMQQDRRPVVVIGSDHAHVDMWSLLVVLRDLSVALENQWAGRPAGEGLDEVASFAEHSAALAAQPPAPEQVRRRWAEILAAGDGVMPRFPMPLGDEGVDEDSPVEVRDIFDAAQRDRFTHQAGSQGVRMIALAVSVLTRVTLGLSGKPLRAVFPVHSRYEQRWRDSVGWFITDSVIESTDPDPRASAQAVTEAIALGSHPLEPIFAPYGGMPVAPGMFALSWLDTRRLTDAPAESQIQYISAVIHDNGVMVWFVVNDAGLHLRARYPATPQAAASMTAWLDAVELGLHDALG